MMISWRNAVRPAAACVGMLLALCGCDDDRPADPSKSADEKKERGDVMLTSTAFENGQPIPAKYTADGADLSPPLAWSGVPDGAKELALICEDPDAPAGTWVHWVLYKIPASASSLAEGASSHKAGTSPTGMVEGENSWPSGNIGYRGPSPPAGRPHRYYFRLYALDAELDVAAGLDAAAFRKAMEGHVLATGELMGTYGR